MRARPAGLLARGRAQMSFGAIVAANIGPNHDSGAEVMMFTQRRRVRFDLSDDTAKPRFVDGKELQNWQEGPEMAAYIRQLMHDGWHLTEGNSRVLTFERRVQ